MSYEHEKTWGHPYRASPLASNYVHKFITGTENKNNYQNITTIPNSNVLTEKVRKKIYFLRIEDEPRKVFFPF